MTTRAPPTLADNKHPELRWREPLLIRQCDDHDLELLIYYEGRLVEAHHERERALAEVRDHLKTQKFTRDRIRSHNGEGRDALADMLMHNARVALGALIAKLRIGCASPACPPLDPTITHLWDTPAPPASSLPSLHPSMCSPRGVGGSKPRACRRCEACPRPEQVAV